MYFLSDTIFFSIDRWCCCTGFIFSKGLIFVAQFYLPLLSNLMKNYQITAQNFKSSFYSLLCVPASAEVGKYLVFSYIFSSFHCWNYLKNYLGFHFIKFIIEFCLSIKKKKEEGFSFH